MAQVKIKASSVAEVGDGSPLHLLATNLVGKLHDQGLYRLTWGLSFFPSGRRVGCTTGGVLGLGAGMSAGSEPVCTHEFQLGPHLQGPAGLGIRAWERVATFIVCRGLPVQPVFGRKDGLLWRYCFGIWQRGQVCYSGKGDPKLVQPGLRNQRFGVGETQR